MTLKKIEWKKLNYIFSVNNNIQESIGDLKLTEDSILFVSDLIKEYNNDVKSKINGTYMSLDEKKKIIEDFLKKVPTGLMILRNHLKNCTYSTSIPDFNFKYEKYVDEDFKRLSFIKHN